MATIEQAERVAARSGDAVAVDEHEARGVFAPALVCWRCEESIDLSSSLAELAEFGAEHARCDEESEAGAW